MSSSDLHGEGHEKILNSSGHHGEGLEKTLILVAIMEMGMKKFEF